MIGSSSRPIGCLRSAPIWVALVVATLTVFGPLWMDLYLPVLPNLAVDLGATASAAQLTMTACLYGLLARTVDEVTTRLDA